MEHNVPSLSIQSNQDIQENNHLIVGNNEIDNLKSSEYSSDSLGSSNSNSESSDLESGSETELHAKTKSREKLKLKDDITSSIINKNLDVSENVKEPKISSSTTSRHRHHSAKELSVNMPKTLSASNIHQRSATSINDNISVPNLISPSESHLSISSSHKKHRKHKDSGSSTRHRRHHRRHRTHTEEGDLDKNEDGDNNESTTEDNKERKHRKHRHHSHHHHNHDHKSQSIEMLDKSNDGLSPLVSDKERSRQRRDKTQSNGDSISRENSKHKKHTENDDDDNNSKIKHSKSSNQIDDAEDKKHRHRSRHDSERKIKRSKSKNDKDYLDTPENDNLKVENSILLSPALRKLSTPSVILSFPKDSEENIERGTTGKDTSLPFARHINSQELASKVQNVSNDNLSIDLKSIKDGSASSDEDAIKSYQRMNQIVNTIDSVDTRRYSKTDDLLDSPFANSLHSSRTLSIKRKSQDFEEASASNDDNDDSRVPNNILTTNRLTINDDEHARVPSALSEANSESLTIVGFSDNDDKHPSSGIVKPKLETHQESDESDNNDDSLSTNEKGSKLKKIGNVFRLGRRKSSFDNPSLTDELSSYDNKGEDIVMDDISQYSPATLARSMQLKVYLSKKYELISEMNNYNPLEVLRFRRKMWRHAVQIGDLKEQHKWKVRNNSWQISNQELSEFINVSEHHEKQNIDTVELSPTLMSEQHNSLINGIPASRSFVGSISGYNNNLNKQHGKENNSIIEDTIFMKSELFESFLSGKYGLYDENDETNDFMENGDNVNNTNTNSTNNKSSVSKFFFPNKTSNNENNNHYELQPIDTNYESSEYSSDIPNSPTKSQNTPSPNKKNNSIKFWNKKPGSSQTSISSNMNSPTQYNLPIQQQHTLGHSPLSSGDVISEDDGPVVNLQKQWANKGKEDSNVSTNSFITSKGNNIGDQNNTNIAVYPNNISGQVSTSNKTHKGFRERMSLIIKRKELEDQGIIESSNEGEYVPPTNQQSQIRKSFLHKLKVGSGSDSDSPLNSSSSRSSYANSPNINLGTNSNASPVNPQVNSNKKDSIISLGSSHSGVRGFIHRRLVSRGNISLAQTPILDSAENNSINQSLNQSEAVSNAEESVAKEGEYTSTTDKYKMIDKILPTFLVSHNGTNTEEENQLGNYVVPEIKHSGTESPALSITKSYQSKTEKQILTLKEVMNNMSESERDVANLLLDINKKFNRIWPQVRSLKSDIDAQDNHIEELLSHQNVDFARFNLAMAMLPNCGQQFKMENKAQGKDADIDSNADSKNEPPVKRTILPIDRKKFMSDAIPMSPLEIYVGAVKNVYNKTSDEDKSPLTLDEKKLIDELDAVETESITSHIDKFVDDDNEFDLNKVDDNFDTEFDMENLVNDDRDLEYKPNPESWNDDRNRALLSSDSKNINLAARWPSNPYFMDAVIDKNTGSAYDSNAMRTRNDDVIGTPQLTNSNSNSSIRSNNGSNVSSSSNKSDIGQIYEIEHEMNNQLTINKDLAIPFDAKSTNSSKLQSMFRQASLLSLGQHSSHGSFFGRSSVMSRDGLNEVNSLNHHEIRYCDSKDNYCSKLYILEYFSNNPLDNEENIPNFKDASEIEIHSSNLSTNNYIANKNKNELVDGNEKLRMSINSLQNQLEGVVNFSRDSINSRKNIIVKITPQEDGLESEVYKVLKNEVKLLDRPELSSLGLSDEEKLSKLKNNIPERMIPITLIGLQCASPIQLEFFKMAAKVKEQAIEAGIICSKALSLDYDCSTKINTLQRLIDTIVVEINNTHSRRLTKIEEKVQQIDLKPYKPTLLNEASYQLIAILLNFIGRLIWLWFKVIKFISFSAEYVKTFIQEKPSNRTEPEDKSFIPNKHVAVPITIATSNQEEDESHWDTELNLPGSIF